ncbi:MAG: S23 ribosomal protein [Ignavibacteria bacterium]|nr:MAG: S23 ribosomal protein [Ignavibacteria bacterium]KAF0161641.1 MAG: S23 ribosomal protein [Ignavibacteria bacterium]
MRDFTKLKIWERSHQLVLKIYEVTKELPKEELYGLTSQLRRASVSIPTNIAEGCGKFTSKDFSRYLTIAIGSLSEVQYLLYLIRELKFISEEIISPLEIEANDLKKMIYSYQSKLSNN